MSVLAKVMNAGEKSTIESSQRPLEKKDFIIADITGSIKLSAWQNHINMISIGNSYEFLNVTVRSWNEVKSLTTSTDTKINPVSNIGPVKQTTVLMEQPETRTTITSVSCKEVTTCIICTNQVNANPQIQTFKCSGCDMRQKTSSLKMGFKCEVFALVDGAMKKFNIPNNLLKQNEITNACLSADSIEDCLLSGNLSIGVCGNSVTNLYRDDLVHQNEEEEIQEERQEENA